jgi:hypothetical protein
VLSSSVYTWAPSSNESKKDLRRQPGFDPITFTFSENSNYAQESLLGV